MRTMDTILYGVNEDWGHTVLSLEGLQTFNKHITLIQVEETCRRTCIALKSEWVLTYVFMCKLDADNTT